MRPALGDLRASVRTRRESEGPDLPSACALESVISRSARKRPPPFGGGNRQNVRHLEAALSPPRADRSLISLVSPRELCADGRRLSAKRRAKLKKGVGKRFPRQRRLLHEKQPAPKSVSVARTLSRHCP